MASPSLPIDTRLRLAAALDRIAYGDDSTVAETDLRELLDLVPETGSEAFLSVTKRGSGGSSTGFAAGVGNVDVEDDRPRTSEFTLGKDDLLRVGQWKVRRYRQSAVHRFIALLRRQSAGWRGTTLVQVEQMMSDPTDQGRAFLVRYEKDGTPVDVRIRAVREMSLPVSSGFEFGMGVAVWVPWKTIAAAARA